MSDQLEEADVLTGMAHLVHYFQGLGGGGIGDVGSDTYGGNLQGWALRYSWHCGSLVT